MAHSKPKRSLKRFAVLRYPVRVDLEEPSPTGQRQNGIITAIRHEISYVLPETSRALQIILGHAVPEVQLEIFSRDADVETVHQSLIGIGQPLSGTRIHFSLDHLNTGVPDLAAAHGLSHILVVYERGSDVNGWSVGTDSSTVYLSAETRLWPIVAHDVLLDIVAFYSDKGPSNRFPSMEYKRRYAKQKAEYVLQQLHAGGLSPFGPVQSGVEFPFLPLALLARSEKGLDLTRYVHYWNDFHSHSFLYPPPESPESYIFSRHPRRGQLSRQKLSKILLSLQPGKYVLLLGEKKPRDPHNREDVLKRFGVPREGQWHANRFRILPVDSSSAYIPMHLREYISVFPFEVT